LIPQDSNPTHLDGKHTVFGEITSGCEHVTAMSEVATGGNDKPVDDVTLLSVTIERTAIEDTSE
ncbi:MAG: peptidylprolyl isomerase, partial [Candidatus Thermoplasmatota archaeon]|nr:peptidylprolyl isomerase [Candidatus Thermoplasmatota archaeon]MEE3083126.1 peptidylprolyl isomerase [Candidatus Thermoplasmatota archaeon]